MNKIISLFLAFAIITTSFSGCSPQSNDEPVTLTMWHVYGSQTESPLNDAINEFNRTVGMDNGILINVVSVTSSSDIDEALAAAAKNTPGAPSLPDLFTAYPRVAEIVGYNNLLNWNEYLTQQELEAFVGDFLEDGYFDSKLLMLPIAKSTELLFVNRTLFDGFASDTDTDINALSTFESLFDTCKEYYEWSKGGDLFQINDFYHYFIVGMDAFGESFADNGSFNLESEVFESIWTPMAKAGIYGGLCLADGYASDRWKTGEVICNVGSTAGILYLRDYVTYPDNTTKNIQMSILPYPHFEGGKHTTIHRGGGLFALNSGDKRKNEAAVCFAKWLTEKENNANFVTQAGYLPVTDSGFDHLFANVNEVENEKYRMLYSTVGDMWEKYNYCDIPVYNGASEVQSSFEKNVKSILTKAHNEFLERVAQGENDADVLDELTASTLSEIRNVYS